MDDYSKKFKRSLSLGFIMKTIITGKASEKDAGEATKALYSSVGQGLKVFLYCAGVALILYVFTLK